MLLRWGCLAFTQMEIHDDHRLDDVTVRVEHEGLRAEARIDAYQIDEIASLLESVGSETKVWAGGNKKKKPFPPNARR